MSWAYSSRYTRHNVCYQCEDRREGCHAICEKYKQAKAENEEVKQKIREEKSNERMFRDVECLSKQRMKTLKGNGVLKSHKK